MTRGEQVTVLKAKPSAYIVVGFIFGLLTLLGGLGAVADRSMVPAFAACALIWVVTWVWLSRLRVVLSADSFSYRSLFGRTRYYRFSEIQKISVESGIQEYSDRFKPFVRLVVVPVESSGARAFYVNLKVFGRDDLQQFFGALRDEFNRVGRPEVLRNL